MDESAVAKFEFKAATYIVHRPIDLARPNPWDGVECAAIALEDKASLRHDHKCEIGRPPSLRELSAAKTANHIS